MKQNFTVFSLQANCTQEENPRSLLSFIECAKILIWNFFMLFFENIKRQKKGFWLCCPRFTVL